MAEITGNDRWDAVGSLAIGLLLGVIAIVLAIEMKSLLIGEVGVTRSSRRASGTRSLEGAEVDARDPPPHDAPRSRRRAGRGEARVPYERVPVLADAIDTVEARVRTSVPEARLMFVEPDLYRPGEGNAAGVKHGRQRLRDR